MMVLNEQIERARFGVSRAVTGRRHGRPERRAARDRITGRGPEHSGAALTIAEPMSIGRAATLA
jgi:hypothetical protein